MKKIVSGFAVILLMLVTNTRNLRAQAVEQGNSIVDVYYGFPNLFTSILKSSYANSGSAYDVKIKGLGPMGMRYEYMFSDKMGFGLEFNYVNSSVEWSDTGSVYNQSTGQYVKSIYNYKVSVPRWRVMPRFSIHFGSSENFDGYFSLAAGYLNTTYKFESNDPNYKNDQIGGIIPFSMRVAVGGRYFLTESLSIGVELGFGAGGIVNGGLGFKF